MVHPVLSYVMHSFKKRQHKREQSFDVKPVLKLIYLSILLYGKKKGYNVLSA